MLSDEGRYLIFVMDYIVGLQSFGQASCALLSLLILLQAFQFNSCFLHAQIQAQSQVFQPGRGQNWGKLYVSVILREASKHLIESFFDCTAVY